MLKFKTSCAVLDYLSSNLLNEVGLSFFRYFEVGLRLCDIVVKKFTPLSHLLMSSCSSLTLWLLAYSPVCTDCPLSRCHVTRLMT